MSLELLLSDPKQVSIIWWLVTESHAEGHLVDPGGAGHLVVSVLCLRLPFVATLFSEARQRMPTLAPRGRMEHWLTSLV